MKISMRPLIFMCVLVPASSCFSAPLSRHYLPQNEYVGADNPEGIKVFVDVKSGSTTQSYDVPLLRAGIPAHLSLTADEAEEECDYKIAFRGKRYRFIRDTCLWSIKLDRNLVLFLFDAGMEYASSANYLDKRFRFSAITMQNGAATERQCTIIPGHKLSLFKAGIGAPDGLDAVVDRIAQRISSGQLSPKDYSCAPTRSP